MVLATSKIAKLVFETTPDKKKFSDDDLFSEFMRTTGSESLSKYYWFRKICIAKKILKVEKELFVFSKKNFSDYLAWQESL